MKKRQGRRTTDEEPISGNRLVADFQSAVINILTMETAKLAAEESEKSTMQSLDYVSGMQGRPYLTPNNIPLAAQESIVRTSVDAHIKKAQSQQITKFTTAQVAQMEADDKQRYHGKKVRVNVRAPQAEPLKSFWFNNKTGKHNEGVVKAKTIKGIIDDIAFEKNLLVLRPTLMSRTMLPSRKYFLVSVVDLETMAPAVELTLL